MVVPLTRFLVALVPVVVTLAQVAVVAALRAS